MSTTTEPVGAVEAPVELAAEVPAESNGLKRILKSLGPGLITGASDDDPSGIGTYALAGASFGYATLWTATAYAVADTVSWTAGLSRKPRDARGFYAVIVAGTVFGMLFNFLGINPIDALFWTAVLNGFLAPPLLVLVMLVAMTDGSWVHGQMVAD